MTETTDWNAVLGQSAYNFIRHVAMDAPGDLLVMLRNEIERQWETVKSARVALEPAVYQMVKLVLGQDLEEIPLQERQPAEPQAESGQLGGGDADGLEKPAAPKPRFELPRFYPQVLPEQLAASSPEPVEAPKASGSEKPPTAVQIYPAAFRPVQNGNATWVGARNRYARFFNAESQKGE